LSDKENLNNTESDLFDEIVDSDEYEKALAALTTSKHSRVKVITDKKKEQKRKDRPKATDEEFAKMSFWKKCLEDPAIPVALLLVVVLLVVAFFYAITPFIAIKSFGYTFEEFSEKYEQTDIYTTLLADYDLDIPQASYSKNELSSVSSGSADEENGQFDLSKTMSAYYLKYFSVAISSDFGTAIIGSSRNADDELAYLRVMVKYDSEVNNTTFMIYYFASFFQAVYDGISTDEAIDMASGIVGVFDGSGEFVTNGDYAYRIVYGTNNSVSYFALDITPKENVT